MNRIGVLIVTFCFCAQLQAQNSLQELVEAERAFAKTAAERGAKAAFLEYLADNSVIFRPEAVNGKDFWNLHKEASPTFLVRSPVLTDISSNGLMGYVTGSFELYAKTRVGKPESAGQYVTIWERRQNGKFVATLDIAITHDPFPAATPGRGDIAKFPSDPNKRGWSAADPSMNFLRMGMGNKALGSAYDKFAGPDVRLLREGSPPIIGKKAVVVQTKDYASMKFPIKLGLLESGDMAYFWNPCEYINSDEGIEKGNCLHIWKLRKKKWYIVLGVFARVINEKPPILKFRDKKNRPK